MKLATMRDGSRDGQLVVVSGDLTQAHYASGIASHLQQVLDDWNFLAPQLQDLYGALNAGHARHAFAFDPAQCLAPLPRAHGWARLGAYPSLGQRCPGLYLGEGAQETSAPFMPPVAQWEVGNAPEVDFWAGWAAIVGDLPRGSPAERAAESVRLVALALSLTPPGGQAIWAGACAPVVVTPDEMGDAWRGGRAHLSLQVQLNGRKFGLCDTGAEMPCGLGDSLAVFARQRSVPAGSLFGVLPVSNADVARGFCSLAEKRSVEASEDGQARTPWLRPGDVLRVQARRPGGSVDLFGAIDLQMT